MSPPAIGDVWKTIFYHFDAIDEALKNYLAFCCFTL